MGSGQTREKVLAITPKIGASLSIPCSLFLIYEVWCDHRTRGSTPIQRALVGMSIVDILSSSAWFISSWAVPEGTWIYAIGNRATCNYQGFLLQLAIGAPLFNASLGLYYALLIRKKWTDAMLAKIEKWVHGVIWTFSIGTSIALLPLDQYNQIGQVCWIIGYPQECGDSTHIDNPDVPCERGDHAWLYGVFLFYGPLWICVGCCTVCMFLVYEEVHRTIVRVRRYSFDERSSRNIGRREVDAVAIQAVLYSASFIITWMPSTLWSIAHWFRFAAFWLDFLSAFCEPLQGMWNFLIFIRARQRTKIKIRHALSTVFPFMNWSSHGSERSREHSGNGRRHPGGTGSSQLRTTTFGDSALYRSATLKGLQANESMGSVSNVSGHQLSVSFAHNNNSESIMEECQAPEASPEKPLQKSRNAIEEAVSESSHHPELGERASESDADSNLQSTKDITDNESNGSTRECTTRNTNNSAEETREKEKACQSHGVTQVADETVASANHEKPKPSLRKAETSQTESVMYFL